MVRELLGPGATEPRIKRRLAGVVPGGGLARRAAPQKFARCNNEIDVRTGDGVGGAGSGEGTLGKR